MSSPAVVPAARAKVSTTGIAPRAILSVDGSGARGGLVLGDAVLRAEGRVSVVDACLAAAFQVDLALNAGRGGWSADSAAGRVVVFYGAAGPSTPSSARRPAPDVVARPCWASSPA